MSVTSQLKLAHKLLICSMVFLLPLAVLLYYAVSDFEQQIQFSAREVAGAKVLQPLCKLAAILGQPQTDAGAGSMDRLFAEIRIAEKDLGPLLPSSAEAVWQAWKTPGADHAARETARQDLLRQVDSAFPRLAESANLILDHQLDSYYLADLALLRMPSLYEGLSRAPDGVPAAGSVEAVRHAVSVAITENRRTHPAGSSLQTNLPRALSAFENAAGRTNSIQAAAGLWQNAVVELRALLDHRAAALRRKEVTALVLTLSAVAFAGAMLFAVIRNVASPLARATGIAEDIAAGRLGAAERSLSRIEKDVALVDAGNGRVRDEAFRLLGAFATMAKSLDSLLNEMRKSCAEVDGSTSQTTSALRQLEATVAEQAASTNQVVASSKEIFATVQKLAQTMRDVTVMSGEAANLAGAGLVSLSGINAVMQDTVEGAGSVSRILNTISTKAANIGSVLTAITNIANRTNLLSLNAAIEAEKAGEQAAGFTAVGLEIRRVADQTAVAAIDIEKMLADMQSAVSEGMRSMAEYADRSRANSQTVNSITADLSRSIECTRRLEPQFEAVNNGMQMQAQAARQILEAMQQLSAAAGQTRDSLAAFHQIAEQMRATVDVLESEVGRFSVA